MDKVTLRPSCPIPMWGFNNMGEIISKYFLPPLFKHRASVPSLGALHHHPSPPCTMLTGLALWNTPIFPHDSERFHLWTTPGDKLDQHHALRGPKHHPGGNTQAKSTSYMTKTNWRYSNFCTDSQYNSVLQLFVHRSFLIQAIPGLHCKANAVPPLKIWSGEGLRLI